MSSASRPQANFIRWGNGPGRLGWARFLCLLLCLGAITSCSSLNEARSEALEAASSNYRKMIRWGYFDEAAKYLRSRDGHRLTIDLKHAARYRVSSYTINTQILSDTGKDGRVIALIEYYEIDSGVIHSLHDVQNWWFDEDEKHWFLDSSLPAFGRDDATPSAGAVSHF